MYSRPWVMINGVKSTMIRGLLIQELPPITKPQIRMRVTEIDGMDGDIVTTLGYESYERDIKIGVFGENYDIDRIISFFDSSGEIIFSNEPEKKYFFSVYDAINFDRLIRFHEATVTVRVQPFKYAANEESITLNSSSTFISGFDFTETDHAVTVTLKGETFTIKGTPSIPSVDFLVPIHALDIGDGTYSVRTVAAANMPTVTLQLLADKQTPLSNAFNPTATSTSTPLTLNNGQVARLLKITVTGATNGSFRINIPRNYLRVFNQGNTFARPLITFKSIRGFTLFINDRAAFEFIPALHKIVTVDCEKMEAYTEDGLVNTHIKGDYSKILLQSGTNILKTNLGNDDMLELLEVKRYSRWI